MIKTFPRRAALIATLALLLVPSLVWGAEGEEGHGLTDILWHLGNLLVFVFILVKFLGPQLREFLFQRRKTIESQLGEARELMASAKARDAEWRAKIEGLQAEAGRITSEAKAIGAAESERILEQARRQAERIRTDAERTAAQEVARAKSQLREESVRLAVALAEQLVRQNVNEADQTRLIEEYLRSMERAS